MARRRPRVLVFQHMELAHPGIFRDCLRAERIAWDVVALAAGDPIPALEEYDALLVMGGAQDVWQEREHPWLRPEKRAIRTAVLELGMPYLGICLGHQLLASALGGEVRPAVTPEVGVFEVSLTEVGRAHPLFAGLATTTWPFAGGWLVGWVLVLLVPAARTRPYGLLAGVLVWLPTVVVGMLLRVASGAGVQTSFVVVATIVLGVFLLGWRGIAALVRRTRGARRDSRTPAGV